MKRLNYLDGIRGFALLSVLIYHFLWDLIYIEQFDMPWFGSEIVFYWQQSVCMTFIFIAGFSAHLSRNKWKTSIKVFMCGALVSAVTIIVMPENRVLFGVLTLIGFSGLVAALLDSLLKKLNAVLGFLLFLFIFIMTKNIAFGSIGIGSFCIEIPKVCFESGYFGAFLGTPFNEFFSTDYFPVIPWMFLYFAGYYFYRIRKPEDWKEIKILSSIPWSVTPFSFMGRHSLIIYMLHQPVLYAIAEGVGFVFGKH